MNILNLQQVPREPVPGDVPIPPPPPVTDPTQTPPPIGDPDVSEPRPVPDAPLIA